MRKTVGVVVLAVLAIASAAVAGSRPLATWVGMVRVEVEGTDGSDGDPHVRIRVSESMGKSGVPLSTSGGSNASVWISLSPAEAEELADAIMEWKANPSETLIFTRTR